MCPSPSPRVGPPPFQRKTAANRATSQKRFSAIGTRLRWTRSVESAGLKAVPNEEPTRDYSSLSILAGAVFVGHYGWVSAGNVVMPAWSWLMMGFGIFFTVVVGGGLMVLIFYSSRAGFDEAPEIESHPEPTATAKTDVPMRTRRKADKLHDRRDRRLRKKVTRIHA